ncbi:MAG: glycoside hydrolase family 127 protein [Oscillospiraceae bacterium]|nr:glycoside hydrolase family 127 protein [Oscillospiraceae bacterium]
MKAQVNIPLKNVKVDDVFWNGIQKLVRDVVVPYQEDIMEDKIPGAEKSGAIENFRIAAGQAEGEHFGMVFQDSDLAKWLEAVAYSLSIKPNPELRKKADEIIDLIRKAQEPDGYINTYFSLSHPERKWQSLHECHELYCSGHMIEAAVAYYKATGDDGFLKIMRRNADLICSLFGNEGGKRRGVPGHQEIELALLLLYDVTGEKSYLDTAKYFIDDRGIEPSYFEEEIKTRGWHQWADKEDRIYAQTHKPVREQDKAVGHSVRAVYMYTAMAALAAETDDRELLDACDKLWENITHKQMYITGGIGSTVHGEAFSVDYDLPNAITYSETCASIAMCFFARRMLEIRPNGQYADVMERMLYNTILASMQLDGKQFFYVNPLEVIPGISGVVQTHKHALPQRPQWYACACCPPNLSRMLLSIGEYAWGEKTGDNSNKGEFEKKSKEFIFAHMFLGGSAKFTVAGGVTINCESGYPYEGKIRYSISTKQKTAYFHFAVHMPGWCKNAEYMVNGTKVSAAVKDGYAYFERNWEDGDVLEISLDLPVLRIYSNLAVSGNAGLVCLQKGPIVYCFEEADNPAPLAALRLPRESEITEYKISEGVLKGISALSAEGFIETGSGELYTEHPPVTKPTPLKAIPYHTWGNREVGEMRVWIRK